MKNKKVEVFGLPGTGKTTLVFKKNGMTLNNKFEKLFFCLIYILTHPLKAFIFLFNIFAYTRSKSIKVWFLLIIRKLFIAYPHSLAIECKTNYKSNFKKNQTILYEDGLLVLALTTFDIPINKRKFKPYISSHSVLILFLEENERFNRMKIRKRIPRSNILNDEELKIYQKTSKYNFQTITNLIPLDQRTYEN